MINKRCPTISQLPPPPPGKTGWPWTEADSPVPDVMTDGVLWPRVSIITPSFNQVQFIEETIRSVLLQGYPNLEYIIIDGGSTDGSVEVIRKYEPWLTFWVSEPDRGQTHAINKGWARATGDVLAYLNTDDFYLPGAVAATAWEFRVKPDTGMVYGAAHVVDEAGEPLRTWRARPFDLKIMLLDGSIVPQPAAFFSRKALEYAGYLNEEWHMIMDYELCIRLGLQFPAVCVPQTLAKFRDHTRSKSRSQFESMTSELMRFVATLNTDQIPSKELRTIKHATLSRIHYECALAFLVQEQWEKPKAFGQLYQSILLHPTFTLRRPVQTAYIVKEVLLAYLAQAHHDPAGGPDEGVSERHS